ncbi:unnamed protein product [Blepharisma stoltei]|uniref:Uncharacterized protein n=1 Tax=Blepharisma stoltei TaxID=1481888 RepID=A0AAU9IFV2_9CILI|nr:unnamed protein product [Blepharisma stoltei]
MIRELFEQDTFEEQFEIIDVELCGEKYRIREFNFHPLNANKVWPGNTVFAGWLLGNLEELKNKKIIELGAGSGILSIFLAKHGIDITTSDYNDTEIPVNIAYNCNLNGISVIPHISHSWGESIDFSVDFDIVVASDILLYVKQYGNLIETLKKLLEKPQSKFWLSNRRRIDTESSFLDMCTASGLSVQNIGPKVFEIKLN